MNKIISLLLLPLVILPMANAQITIKTVGDGSGYDLLGEYTNEVAAYRSTGVAKSFDVDGDNCYGTEGVLAFGDGGARINQQAFSMHTKVGLSWAEFSPGKNFWTTAQNQLDSEPMDDPTAPIAPRVANWKSVGMLTADGMKGSGAWAEMLKFDIYAAAPQRFRIGLIAGTQFAPTGHWDPTALRMALLSALSRRRVL